MRKLVPTYNFTDSFSRSANSLLRTTFRRRDLGSNRPNDQNSVEEQFLNPGTTTTLKEAPVAIGKNGVASKTSKAITAW